MASRLTVNLLAVYTILPRSRVRASIWLGGNEGIDKEGIQSGKLALAETERQWLDRAEAALADVPRDEEALVAEMRDTYGHLFRPASYGLGV